MAVKEGLEDVLRTVGIHNFVCTGRNTKRHGTSSESFGKATNVGLSHSVLARKSFAGTTKACHDLIGNADSTVFFCHFDHRIQHCGGIHAISKEHTSELQ